MSELFDHTTVFETSIVPLRIRGTLLSYIRGMTLHTDVTGDADQCEIRTANVASTDARAVRAWTSDDSGSTAQHELLTDGAVGTVHLICLLYTY